jgi:hypothetical protein
MEFEAFPKIPRITRGCIITEKIDGTNGQIYIYEEKIHNFIFSKEDEAGHPTTDDCPTVLKMLVGSRSRWLDEENDNYGFYKWAMANREELMKLGPGRHYGEWWGAGIQRRYDQTEKRFSLFNSTRWEDPDSRPPCCGIVPILYRGLFSSNVVDDAIQALREQGSHAAPGFMKPEGVIVYLTDARLMFKKTLENDEKAKGDNS